MNERGRGNVRRRDTVKSNANHVEDTGVKTQRIRRRRERRRNHCNEGAIRFTFDERYKVSQERIGEEKNDAKM
jgi:hypothetical protein